jgi:hypothetical protein
LGGTLAAVDALSLAIGSPDDPNSPLHWREAQFDCGRDLIEDGRWDIEMITDSADDTQQQHWWAPQLKSLLGLGEHLEEFGPVLASWPDRLHTEGKDPVFAAFAAHLRDTSDATPYDVEYRIRKRDGTYT